MVGGNALVICTIWAFYIYGQSPGKFVKKRAGKDHFCINLSLRFFLTLARNFETLFVRAGDIQSPHKKARLLWILS